MIHNLQEFNNPDINRDNMLRKHQCYYIAKDWIKYTDNQPEQRSNEWFVIRGSYVTASQVATTVGKNKYQTIDDSLKQDAGINPKFVGNEATEFGTKYEPVVTLIYEDELNEYYQKNNPQGVTTKFTVFESAFIKGKNPSYPYIGGSPDGIVLQRNYKDGKLISRDGFGIEIKCPMMRWPKEDVVPLSYWMQMQMQLEVSDLEKVYFLDFKIKEFDTFDEFEESIDTFGCIKKGAVIEIILSERPINNGTSVVNTVTVYSPIFDGSRDDITGDDVVDNDEIEQWVQRIQSIYSKKKYVSYKVNYWVLIKKFYTKVYRDREWMNANLDKIRDYWYNKNYYKEHFLELFNDDIDDVNTYLNEYEEYYDDLKNNFIPYIYDNNGEVSDEEEEIEEELKKFEEEWFTPT